MKFFETFATVQPQGDVHVPSVPFAPGMEVEITIIPKRRSAKDFADTWNHICHELRMLPQSQSITEQEIQQEIDDYRAGR